MILTVPAVELQGPLDEMADACGLSQGMQPSVMTQIYGRKGQR